MGWPTKQPSTRRTRTRLGGRARPVDPVGSWYGTGISFRSNPLGGTFREEALRSNEKHQQQDNVGRHLLIASELFNDADENPTDQRSRDTAKSSDHRRGESLDPQKSHVHVDHRNR